ncbi:RNA polymerase sigma factor [Flavobacterium cerinum]|uniref:Sigma-70 family RNA polymerase sigma factor n=1 Tax=Flavobacterium cerinum TaxID=2502784 RepID=A0A3S3R0F6_9FLAO|nr:sigma-70 family RNA polymerase sigma factor [Flavobacterium cerinum]RWX00480.1 sigma-70 family RNA polymerase sigma factor [Flavobacterium cerinum]
MEKEFLFNKIFEEHYPKILRLSKGYFNGDTDLANDAAQEVFMKVWEHLDSFRGDSSVSTWIYRISVNTCLVLLRKKNSKKGVLTKENSTATVDSDSEEMEERFIKMYACIQKLEEINRMIILMVLENIGYDEIANIIGITEENVRVRIHRIKKSLTQCVQL